MTEEEETLASQLSPGQLSPPLTSVGTGPGCPYVIMASVSKSQFLHFKQTAKLTYRHRDMLLLSGNMMTHNATRLPNPEPGIPSPL